MKPVTQEASMGCAIACAASVAGLSYKKMRRYFEEGERYEYSRGFYNRHIVQALKRVGIPTRASSVKRWGDRKFKNGTIVFVGPSEKYLAGHYFLKTSKGWMNPWINCPSIKPATSGFQKNLPGKIRWLIEVL
jgi:hypothetical protein